MSGPDRINEAPPTGRRFRVEADAAMPAGQEGPVVNQRACVLCGACRDVCPVGAITIATGAVVVCAERCDGCGACIRACTPRALR